MPSSKRFTFQKLAFALCAAALGACASQSGGSRVSARVLDLKSGAVDTAGVSPAAGAHVAAECAGKKMDLGVTDADGVLRVDTPAPVMLDCTASVTQEGFRPVKHSVASLCSDQSGNICRSLDLRAVLTPESAGGSSSASGTSGSGGGTH